MKNFYRLLAVTANILLTCSSAMAQGTSPVAAPASPIRDSGIKMPASGFAPLALPPPQARADGISSCTWVSTVVQSNVQAIAPAAADFGAIYTNAGFSPAVASNVPVFSGRTFKVPSLSQCCKVREAVLTVNYFARVAGGPVGGANSSNDTGGLVEGGNYVAGSYGFIGHPTGLAATAWAGTKIVNYVVPAYIINSGTVSFHAADQTSIVSATLKIVACCDP